MGWGHPEGLEELPKGPVMPSKLLPACIMATGPDTGENPGWEQGGKGTPPEHYIQPEALSICPQSLPP